MTRPLLCLLLLFATAAGAQDAAPASLQNAIERARSAVGPGEEPVEAVRTQLDQALADDQDADRLYAEARLLTASIPTETREATRLEAALRADPADTFRLWRQALGENPDAAALAPRLATLRAAADASADALARTTAALGESDARPAAIALAIEQTRRSIDELDAIASDPGAESSPAGLAALASQRRARAQIARLEAEQAQLPAHRRLLELRQQQQQREGELQRRQIEVLETLLSEDTDAELTALEQRLQADAAAATGSDPLVVTEVARNVELGKELAQTERASRRASEQLRLAQQERSDTADALRNTHARLALGSADDAVGLILLNERRRLDDPDAIAQELEDTRRSLAQTQLRAIDLDEQAQALASPDAAAGALLQEQENEEGVDSSTLRLELAAAFATRAELVNRLRADQRALAQQLSDLERVLQQQLESARALNAILDRELLWFPSHEPVGSAWLQRQIAGWADLFKPSRYATSVRLLIDAFEQQWPWVALAVVLFGVLAGLARQVPARLVELAQPLMRIRTDKYRYTSRALLLTTLAAAAWPLLLATVGWLLQHAGQPGKFSDSLGRSLLSAAFALLLYQMLRWLSRENGVGHKHFRWTRARRDSIRAALPWLCGVLLPLHFLLMLAFVRGQEPAVDAAARLMLLAFCGVGAWVAWRLLAPGAVWTTRGSSDIEPVRLRKLVRVLLPLLLGAVMLLALNGYVLTAAVILQSLWMSAAMLVATAIGHGLISRWFLLGERRLALKRLEQKHEAEALAAAATAAARTGIDPTDDTAPKSVPAATPASDPETELLTLQSVNQQTRRLLRALTVSLLAIGLLWVWSDVLPALDRLDEIGLWNVSALDEDGKPIVEPVTLGSLLFGMLALALTFVAARNLPGLVELGMLSRIHLDAATRYAITSVCRYIIVIGGLILGLSLLGVRWNQLQWLAAALTVGLGFGLQEIFANFVSGLIILFERPFRVGDTITIDDVEGTVTRIRTRATTLLDADNREVVVPNKTFITSRFINWTLSDTVTRVVVKLNLAQDSDPHEVRQLLLDIARAHPLVLESPPVACWFLQISGTYDFELRVHVGDLLHRNRVRDDLNRSISAAMKERDIATARAGTMNIHLLRPEAQTPQAPD